MVRCDDDLQACRCASMLKRSPAAGGHAISFAASPCRPVLPGEKPRLSNICVSVIWVIGNPCSVSWSCCQFAAAGKLELSCARSIKFSMKDVSQCIAGDWLTCQTSQGLHLQAWQEMTSHAELGPGSSSSDSIPFQSETTSHGLDHSHISASTWAVSNARNVRLAAVAEDGMLGWLWQTCAMQVACMTVAS